MECKHIVQKGTNVIVQIHTNLSKLKIFTNFLESVFQRLANFKINHQPCQWIIHFLAFQKLFCESVCFTSSPGEVCWPCLVYLVKTIKKVACLTSFVRLGDQPTTLVYTFFPLVWNAQSLAFSQISTKYNLELNLTSDICFPCYGVRRTIVWVSWLKAPFTVHHGRCYTKLRKPQQSWPWVCVLIAQSS